MLSTFMEQEALASAQSVKDQGENAIESIIHSANALKALRPQCGVTVARGSSDHAANYLAYLIMQQLGLPVTSLPMSLQTLYQAPLRVKNQFAIGISQSGKSPDLLQTMRALKMEGARTFALVNRIDSPLAGCVDHAIDLHAKLEQSVAATKSFITSLAASARLVSYWSDNLVLQSFLTDLHIMLEQAQQCDWNSPLNILSNEKIKRIMVVGRGFSLSAALEAALKFKETCGIQAEAFSGAEIKHGPMALINDQYPLLIFAPKGKAQADLLNLAHEMKMRGACVILAASKDVRQRDITLYSPTLDNVFKTSLATSYDLIIEDILSPMLSIQSFYLMAAKLSLARGLNPDAPAHLKKETQTF